MKIKQFLLFALLLAGVRVSPVSSQIVATQEQSLGVGFTINFTESPVSMRDPAALKKIFD